jgi:hypothetical protein
MRIAIDQPDFITEPHCAWPPTARVRWFVREAWPVRMTRSYRTCCLKVLAFYARFLMVEPGPFGGRFFNEVIFQAQGQAQGDRKQTLERTTQVIEYITNLLRRYARRLLELLLRPGRSPATVDELEASLPRRYNRNGSSTKAVAPPDGRQQTDAARACCCCELAPTCKEQSIATPRTVMALRHPRVTEC